MEAEDKLKPWFLVSSLFSVTVAMAFHQHAPPFMIP